jgi:hypothetical protein
LGAGAVAGAASTGFVSGNAAAGAALDLSSDLPVCAVEKLLKDMEYPFHNSNNDLPLAIIWWIYKWFSIDGTINRSLTFLSKHYYYIQLSFLLLVF